MTIQLSICIPTYNRISELKGCLEFLLPQVQVQPAGRVEVVIIDNASTDGTREFIDTLPATYSFIRVFHNPANLGFDGNSAKCIEYADGEYTALLSDDDRYLDGQVAAILDVVSRQDYALVVLNYYGYIKDPHRPYKTYVPEQDVLFSQAWDVLSHGWVGHFSGIIYRTALAKETLANILAKAPLTNTDRSRGIYFEVALRIAHSTNLPAFYIGKRGMAAQIPPTVDYDEIQNMGVDTCQFFTNLYDEGIISRADLDFRYNSVLGMLPTLAIRCTPKMSPAEITRVTIELKKYLGNDPRFHRTSLPLLRAAQYAPVRWFYRTGYSTARFIKRTLKGVQ